MKTNQVNRPGLRCRAVRSWVAFFNSDGRPMPTGLGSAHVQQCADCQAFWRSEEELSDSLRSDGLMRRALEAPGLEQRIIYAAQRAARPERSAATRFNLMPLAGVMASAALLAVLLAPRIQLPIAPSQPSRGATSVPEEKVITVQEAEQNLRNYLNPPVELLRQNPLQNEVELVYSDARSAWRFLELNFLPATTEGSSRKREGV